MEDAPPETVRHMGSVLVPASRDDCPGRGGPPGEHLRSSSCLTRAAPGVAPADTAALLASLRSPVGLESGHYLGKGGKGLEKGKRRGEEGK